MRVIETTVYTYAELSGKAKERAREWYLKDFEFHHDFVFEDVKAIGALMGIDIDDIRFTGFWSQGDGASFRGRFTQRAGIVDAVKAYAPNDTKLHGIAARLELTEGDKPQSGTVVYTSHRYCHDNTMDVGDEPLSDDELPIDADTRDALRAFARWTYDQLESAYEFDTSDEQVAENIEENEYTFTADGRRFG